ncbi:hypothetical protein PVAP13_1NG170176 [Panicum virgatum]|uniref:Uncharacterized protein n=1 Tax=Panicum virgatum TaxID=38727 RepID=A0A8T0X0G7_PANVG|nr:hypothetical protein PVAP13_1NG170176 [Panicum virgatum]
MRMPMAIESIQKLPKACSTFWKWPTWLVLSTRCAALPKKVCTPVAITTASISPCLHVEPEHSPVRADWSILSGSPCSSRASAAELDAYDVPWDEDRRVLVAPPAVTDVLGARLAMSSLAALPALFSSQNEMVELMRRSATMPTKSCHHWRARWPSRRQPPSPTTVGST